MVDEFSILFDILAENLAHGGAEFDVLAERVNEIAGEAFLDENNAEILAEIADKLEAGCRDFNELISLFDVNEYHAFRDVYKYVHKVSVSPIDPASEPFGDIGCKIEANILSKVGLDRGYIDQFMQQYIDDWGEDIVISDETRRDLIQKLETGRDFVCSLHEAISTITNPGGALKNVALTLKDGAVFAADAGLLCTDGGIFTAVTSVKSMMTSSRRIFHRCRNQD